MSDEVLVVERQDRICTITLNRPDRRNSLNPEMLMKLADTLEALNDDLDVRVVVIRGAGETAFSAGYDIGKINTERAAEQRKEPAVNPLQRGLASVMSYRFPVIAMIHGFCIGAGCDLAVTCDLRYAADTLKMGMTPAKLGVMYHYGGVQRFIDVVGVGATKEIFFTGRLLDAQQAKEIGLVNRVLPAAELESFVYAVAKEIAANAPLSVAGAKITIARLTGFRRLSGEEESELQGLIAKCSTSEDLKEGQRAFMEKRKPNFVGR